MTPLSRQRPASCAWSLAARLTAWYVLSAFALIAVATILLYVSFVKNLDREHDQFLIDKIRVMRGLLRERPSDEVSLREEVEEDSGAAAICADLRAHPHTWRQDVV